MNQIKANPIGNMQPVENRLSECKITPIERLRETRNKHVDKDKTKPHTKPGFPRNECRDPNKKTQRMQRPDKTNAETTLGTVNHHETTQRMPRSQRKTKRMPRPDKTNAETRQK